MIDFLDRLREAKSMFAYTDRDKRTKELLSEIYNTIAGSVVWAWRWEIGDEHGYADRKEDIPANADAVTPLYRHPQESKPVGYTSQRSIDDIANGECSGSMFGEFSERYDRTVPLYTSTPKSEAERMELLECLYFALKYDDLRPVHLELLRKIQSHLKGESQ